MKRKKRKRNKNKEKECTFCGRNIEKGHLCSLCHNKKFYFSKNYYISKYEDVMKQSIYAFKYGNKKENAKAYGVLLKKWCEHNNEYFENIDLIIGVPMYEKKRKKRGYNQADLIALQFAKILNINYSNKTVKRIKETKVQSGLNPEKRVLNMENAFKVINKQLIANKNILIVDDIYTTGSTINALAKELKENGANNILSLTLAVVDNKKQENVSVLDIINYNKEQEINKFFGF